MPEILQIPDGIAYETVYAAAEHIGQVLPAPIPDWVLEDGANNQD